MIWRLSVEFPEGVLFIPGKERQQGPMVGVGGGVATPEHRSYSTKQAFMKMLGLLATSPVLPQHLVYLNLGSSSIFIEVSKFSINKVLRILLST